MYSVDNIPNHMPISQQANCQNRHSEIKRQAEELTQHYYRQAMRGLHGDLPRPYQDGSQQAIMPNPKLEMRDVRASDIEDMKYLVNGLMQQIAYLQSRINSL